MKYVVEMGSDTMIYIPSFIKIDSRVQNLVWDTHTQTHRQLGDLISLTSICFFKIRKVG
jgi:hypothetical protein